MVPYAGSLKRCCCNCPRGEAGESPALVRNREWCADEAVPQSRDTSRAGEFPPSRHKDRGSVTSRMRRGSRAEIREGASCKPSVARSGVPQRLALATLLASGAVTVLLGAGTPAGAAIPPGPIQVSAAQAAAQWLSEKLTPQGYITDTPGGPADLSATVNTVLAMAAANVDLAQAGTALSYLATNSSTYIENHGSDGPGQLALLILAAHSMGQSPTDFGGTNLVTRLLATEQTSGPNTGLFGTDAQAADYGGTYDQGLALAALHAAGVAADGPAVNWLLGQQCPDGGWPIKDQADNPCDTDPGCVRWSRHQHHLTRGAGARRAGRV